jgi:hypothetical protein
VDMLVLLVTPLYEITNLILSIQRHDTGLMCAHYCLTCFDDAGGCFDLLYFVRFSFRWAEEEADELGVCRR